MFGKPGEGRQPEEQPARKRVKYEPDEDRFGRPLTAREDDVLYWTVRGETNEEIAERLGGNSETVRKHVENIRRKLGAKSRLALIAGQWRAELDKLRRRIAELERENGELKRPLDQRPPGVG